MTRIWRTGCEVFGMRFEGVEWGACWGTRGASSAAKWVYGVLAAGLAPRGVWCCLRIVRRDKGPVLAWLTLFQWIVDGVLNCFA